MNKKINDYKAVIINGVNNKGDIDGNIDYVGDLDEYGFHIDALIEYALEKYPDVQVFSKIPSNCEFDVPIFFLTWLNNIVYVNVSDVKHGKKGIVFFPDEVSLKQKDALYDFAKGLSNVNITVIYNMDFDDGLVFSHEFDCKRGMSFEEILDDFFNDAGKELLVQEKKPKR